MVAATNHLNRLLPLLERTTKHYSRTFYQGTCLCCLIAPVGAAPFTRIVAAALISFVGYQFLDRAPSSGIENASKAFLGRKKNKAKAADIAILLRNGGGPHIRILYDTNALKNLEGELIISPKALASDRIKTLPMEMGKLHLVGSVFVLIVSTFIVGLSSAPYETVV